jgi:hypothetical protein
MAQNIVLEPDDPRRISAVLAPVPPPPTHEIVAEQRSRFGTVESNEFKHETFLTARSNFHYLRLLQRSQQSPLLNSTTFLSQS